MLAQWHMHVIYRQKMCVHQYAVSWDVWSKV